MGLTKTQSGGLADDAKTTINNNADNRVITGSGTANTLNGESGLTFDGTELKVGGDSGVSGTFGLEVYNTSGNVGSGLFAGLQGADIFIQDTGSGESFRLAANGQASLYSLKGGDNMVFHTTPSGGSALERMRIDSSGKVLIGTTTEGNQGGNALTIHQATNSMGMTLRSGDSSNSHIYFSDATSGAGEYAGYIAYQHSDNSMHIGTDSAERIHIKSNGNVGIGTSSPTDKLDLNGTANLRSNTYIGGDLYMYGGSYSNGIFLGGSTSPNKLDDYEEGTFDAINNYNTIWYSNENKCSYTKIGRQVTCTGQIRQYSGSGDIRMGLPFTVSNGSEGEFKGSGSLSTYGQAVQYASDGDGVTVLIDRNQPYVDFMEIHDNAAWTHLQTDAGAYLRFTFTYFTDS